MPALASGLGTRQVQYLLDAMDRTAPNIRGIPHCALHGGQRRQRRFCNSLQGRGRRKISRRGAGAGVLGARPGAPLGNPVGVGLFVAEALCSLLLSVPHAV